MRQPTHLRLRALRESLKLSQGKVGERCGHNQNWISGRELGNVDLLADQALEIVEAMDLAGELVILPKEHRHLLARLGEIDPESAALAVRLALALPHLDTDARDMWEGMIDLAEKKASRAVV